MDDKTKGAGMVRWSIRESDTGEYGWYDVVDQKKGGGSTPLVVAVVWSRQRATIVMDALRADAAKREADRP